MPKRKTCHDDVQTGVTVLLSSYCGLLRTANRMNSVRASVCCL